MHRTKSGAWIMVGMGLVVSLINAAQLWGHLSVVDWLIIAMLMAAPPLGVWRHLREVDDITDKAHQAAMQIGIGGYVPLLVWVGVGAAVDERVMLRGNFRQI